MRVLIIDDQEDFHVLLTAVLKGFLGRVDLDSATTIAAAIQRLKDNPDYDLVISDFRFPEGTGDEIFRFLRSTGSASPFILFSSLLPTDLSDFEGEFFFEAVAKSDIAHLQRAVQHAVLDRVSLV